MEDEGRHAEALAFEGVGLEVVCVGAGLRLGGRADRDWVHGIFTGHDGERDGGVCHVARDGACVVEEPIKRCDTCDANQSSCGEYADDGAGCGGHANGVSRVGAVAEHGEVGGDRGYGSAGRAAGAESNVIGVAGAPVGGAAVSVAGGEIGHVGFAENDGSGGTQFRDDGGVAGSDEFVSGNHVTLPSIAGDQPLDAGVFFDDYGDAPEEAVIFSAGGLGVFAGGGGEGSFEVKVFYRAVDGVVFVNAVDVPVHDLGDGVFVGGIQMLKLGDCYLKEVTIDGGFIWLRLGLSVQCSREGKREPRDCRYHQHAK